MERDGAGEKEDYEKRCRPETLGTGKEMHREEEYAKKEKNSAGSWKSPTRILWRNLS
jgi:hypothetical protein